MLNICSDVVEVSTGNGKMLNICLVVVEAVVVVLTGNGKMLNIGSDEELLVVVVVTTGKGRMLNICSEEVLETWLLDEVTGSETRVELDVALVLSFVDWPPFQAASDKKKT